MPYLLVALFPRLISFLPKPVLGWIRSSNCWRFCCLVRSYFCSTHSVTTITSQYSQRSWCLVWLLDHRPSACLGQYRSSAVRLGWWGFDGLCSSAFCHSNTDDTACHTELGAYTEARLQQLQREGKTVMIDFTASWCSNCHVNFKVAINTPETSKLIAELDAVPMLADMSDTNEEINRKLVELQSNSIPVLAIYPGGQATKPIVLRDVLTQSQVSKALKYAGEIRKGGRLTSTPSLTENWHRSISDWTSRLSSDHRRHRFGRFAFSARQRTHERRGLFDDPASVFLAAV